MVELYGRTFSHRSLREHAGQMSQFAGVRLMELSDGVERGVRVLEFRTGSGLRFTALVDRALDIGDCEHKGRAIGWNSPAGFRNPALHEYEGEGGLAYVRSFSGLLVTCGLDHTGVPQEVPADEYNYPGRRTVRHSLHGRIGMIPARLTGYGETWQDDGRCVLWAEGIVQQSTMFGEDLHLHRRIEADVGGDEIRISDRVVNHGFYSTPHMFFYHVNVGHPVLEEGARYLAPVRDVVWASHAQAYRAQGVGWRTMGAPKAGFGEQVWQHELGADAEGWVPAALVNDRIGLGFELRTKKSQLPCFYEWQNFQAGLYTVGIEPASHHVLGDLAARERGEMIRLEHSEERLYDAVFRVLDGAEAIADAGARIDAIAKAPDEDFPEPSGDFPKLHGA